MSSPKTYQCLASATCSYKNVRAVGALLLDSVRKQYMELFSCCVQLWAQRNSRTERISQSISEKDQGLHDVAAAGDIAKAAEPSLALVPVFARTRKGCPFELSIYY